MPCEPEWRRRGARVCPSARACPSVRLPDPVVAAFRSRFRAGVECRRAFGRPKRHEAMRKPMERGQGGGNHRRPDLAAVFVPMPCEPLSRHVALGRFRSGAGACPSARARSSAGLSVSLVAAVVGSRFGAGVECRRALGCAAG
jgi:hypothetical protein